MDKFIQIIQENNLRAEEIEKVTAIVIPDCAEDRGIGGVVTEEDFPWNAPYLIACAAHGINRSRWHESDTLKDPKILEFMKKVGHEVADIGPEVLGKELLFYTVTGAEVVARGKTFREIGHCKDGVCEVRKVGDDEVIEKFINNVARVLPSDKANKVVQTVLKLEKMEDVTELIRMVTL